MTDRRFKITCPHCKTEFECQPGGCSLHCFDYEIVGSDKRIYGIISTGMLECPVCHKEFKE